MITKAQALVANNFYHGFLRDSKGMPKKARRNGKTKTWKTKPEAWEIPLKAGLYNTFRITQDEATHWFLSEGEALAHGILHEGVNAGKIYDANTGMEAFRFINGVSS